MMPNRPKLGADGDSGPPKRKTKNIKQKKKNQDFYLPNPANTASNNKNDQAPQQSTNDLLQYKMQIHMSLVDYMCYLEQMILDTKAKAAKEKKTVANIILNMARFFEVPHVNQQTINTQNAIVEGKELQFQMPFDKLDWFDVLQQKRFESYLAEKPKEEQKSIQKQTNGQNIIRLTLNNEHYEAPQGKKKNNKKMTQTEDVVKKKRKIQQKQQIRVVKENDMISTPASIESGVVSGGGNFRGNNQQVNQKYSAVIAKILGNDQSQIDINLIGGFQKYMTAYPDFKDFQRE